MLVEKIRLLVSGAGEAFREERRALTDFVRADPLLGKYFEVVLSDGQEATDGRAENRFPEGFDAGEVRIGLFEESSRRRHGPLSSTEQEFSRATKPGRHRLAFVRHGDDGRREAGTAASTSEPEQEVVRARFHDIASLTDGLYRALIGVMEDRHILQTGRFEQFVCHGAHWRDLDDEALSRFVRVAREKGGLPPGPDIEQRELLSRLDLLKDGRLTNAAILLFGSAPHWFVPCAEIKCVQILGLRILDPIQTLEHFQGNLMSVVDAATTFVMSRQAGRVGERAEGPPARQSPEIPVEAVTEAIVNAVAHRDYAISTAVTVTLFRDRLEVYNPGALRHPRTVDDLFRDRRSVARNPTILCALRRTGYAEQKGTGIPRLIEECRKAGVPLPRFTTRRGFVVEFSRRRVWDREQKGAAFRRHESRGTGWR